MDIEETLPIAESVSGGAMVGIIATALVFGSIVFTRACGEEGTVQLSYADSRA